MHSSAELPAKYSGENKRNNGETTIDPNTKAMTKHMLAKAEESETTYLEPETQTNSTFVVNNKTKTSDSVKKSTTTRKEKVTKKLQKYLIKSYKNVTI